MISSYQTSTGFITSCYSQHELLVNVDVSNNRRTGTWGFHIIVRHLLLHVGYMFHGNIEILSLGTSGCVLDQVSPFSYVWRVRHAKLHYDLLCMSLLTVQMFLIKHYDQFFFKGHLLGHSA